MTTKSRTVWQHKAACIGASTEIFYSSKHIEALTYCNRCPVTRQCLKAADKEEEPYGMLIFGVCGGETAKQRIKRRALLKAS